LLLQGFSHQGGDPAWLCVRSIPERAPNLIDKERADSQRDQANQKVHGDLSTVARPGNAPSRA
jgi:hypothetical protein